MVDDRYNWLDEESAERLLRGLPVDGQHVHGAEEASGAGGNADATVGGGAAADGCTPPDRLAAALKTLSVQSVPEGELPGEAAAVEAFRAARATVLRSSSVPVGAVGTAAEGSAGGPARRLVAAWSEHAARPLRAGLAVAVAGCALGGVAVAAGTGMLPAPFGSGGGGEPPAPSVSASPAITPVTGGAQGGPGHGPDGRGGQESREDEKKDSTSPESPHGDSTDGEAPGGAGGPNGVEPELGEKWGGLTEAQKKDLAPALCKAYVEHKFDAEDRRKLERAAGGPAALEEFCARNGGPVDNTVGGGEGGDGDGGLEGGDTTDPGPTDPGATDGTEGGDTEGGDTEGGDTTDPGSSGGAVGGTEGGDSDPSGAVGGTDGGNSLTGGTTDGGTTEGGATSDTKSDGVGGTDVDPTAPGNAGS